MQQHNLYEDILNSSINGVIAVNLKGRISFANRRACSLLSVSIENLIKRRITDILPDIVPIISESIKDDTPKFGHYFCLENKTILISVTPFKRNEKKEGCICNIQEVEIIENIARTLEIYKELNRQLEAIFSSSSDGLQLIDSDGIILKINEASEKLNGIQRSDFIGKKVLNFVKDGTVNRIISIEVLETKRRVSTLQYNKRTNKYLLLTGTPVFQENGEISLVVVNERDITELNLLREQLKLSRMAAEKYKDELTNMSLHGFREHGIIAESKEMRNILTASLKLANLGVSTILILGESGTGKNLIAKFIHYSKKYEVRPFLHINCAALPENLLEAELFGYERGAFTGASEKGKIGLFELAENGTLFLDEIGELPHAMQAKLLKYLEDHEVRRIGGTKSRKIECRIIAATNRDLESQVRERRFRQDLYYRLNAFTIRIPPLRERREDILEMTNYFLSKYNREYGQNKRVSSEMIDRLQAYAFPGNVRELKNLIKNSVVMSDRDMLDDINFLGPSYVVEKWNGPGNQNRRMLPLNLEVNAVEKELLKIACAKCRTTREMATYLQISQPTIIRKMRKYGLSLNK
jgi:PAS domain S-box-containing protein